MGSDREVLAGTAVELGSTSQAAPEVTWDFGDGSPRQVARGASHAYARPGRYRVQALRGEQALSQVELTVVPRPVTLALPQGCSSAIWLPTVAVSLERTVDFFERLSGAPSAQGYLEGALLPALAIELLATDALALDTQEGLGVFTLPAFRGAVALLGIADEQRAMATLLRQLEARGGVGRQEPDGTVRVELPDGKQVALLVDRGYLYAVVPDPDERERGSPDFAVALSAIRGNDERGLSASPVLGRARVAPGNVLVFVAPPARPAQRGRAGARQLDGVLLSLQIEDAQVRLDGALLGDGPIWDREGAQVASLLRSAPEEPFFAASFSAQKGQLAALFSGGLGSDARRSAEPGRPGIDIERLLSSLAGDVGVLAYSDPLAFYRNLIEGTQRPAPRGAVLAEAGLVSPGALDDAVTELLEGSDSVYDRKAEGGSVRYRGIVMGQPGDLALSDSRARLLVGTGVDARPKVDVGVALRRRFGPDAFGPGHLTLMIDLGRLRHELEEPRNLGGVDPRRMVELQGFASAFLSQLTPIELVFLDAVPTPDGGRVVGHMLLRARQKL